MLRVWRVFLPGARASQRGRPVCLRHGTSEGQSFTAAVDGLPFPWTHSAINGLEDFAWTCAFWYLDPERLVTVGGQARYDWVRRNLP